MVIWISGLSGVGKSYLANQLIKEQSKSNFIHLDGDHVRKCFKFNNLDLGYTLKDRKIQINRLKSIAKILCDQNFNIIICAVYMTDKIINDNRNLFKNYFHIHLEKNINILKEINNKKIYSKNNVYGQDIKSKKITLADVNYNYFLNQKEIRRLIKSIKI